MAFLVTRHRHCPVDYRVLHGALSRLEPGAGKLARRVLRGPGDGDVTRLPDWRAAVDNGLLIAVNPPGQGDDQEVNGLYEERHCGMRVFVISFGINIIQIVRIFSPYAMSVTFATHWS